MTVVESSMCHAYNIEDAKHILSVHSPDCLDISTRIQFAQAIALVEIAEKLSAIEEAALWERWSHD